MKLKPYTIYAYSERKDALVHLVTHFQQKGCECQLEQFPASNKYRIALLVGAYSRLGALVATAVLRADVKIAEKCVR